MEDISLIVAPDNQKKEIRNFVMINLWKKIKIFVSLAKPTAHGAALFKVDGCSGFCTSNLDSLLTGYKCDKFTARKLQ